MAPTEIFSDGFESGDYSAWTDVSVDPDNTLEVQSGQKHHGTYGSKHILAPNNIQEPCYCYKDIDAQTTIFMRLYVKITEASLPLANRCFIFMMLRGFLGAGVSYRYADLGVISSSRYLFLRYRTSAGEQTDTSSTTLDLNTWYCIELKFVEHATNGEVRVYLNDVEVEDLTHTGLNTAVWTGVKSVQCGSSSGWENEVGSYATFYTDCVVVADAYIGPEVPVVGGVHKPYFTLTL